MRLLLLISVLASACTAGETYFLRGDLAREVQKMSDAERKTVAVPAERGKKRVPALVQGESLRLDNAVSLPDGTVRAKAKAYSRLVAAGSALTWIGMGIAYVGVGMFAARFNERDSVFTAGWATRVAIEPVLLLGTALWIQGAKGRPQEDVGRRRQLQLIPTPEPVLSEPPPQASR